MPARFSIRTIITLAFAFAGLCSIGWAAGTGELELNVIDADSREPIAVRIHLRDQRGRPVKVPRLTSFGDHMLFDRTAVLKLPVGEYSFEMERGIEYRTRTGRFSIARGAADNKTVEMHRFVDMAAEGWYSGDCLVNRSSKDCALSLLAEDLHVAVSSDTAAERNSARSDHRPQVTFVGKHRFYSFSQAVDRRKSGIVSLVSAVRDQEIRLPNSTYPWTFFTDPVIREEAHRHTDIATASHADLPMWLAGRQVNSIEVLSGMVLREGSIKSDAGRGRVPDPVVYAPPLGAGRWSTDIYYDVLNAGFQIPPSAGSGSGMSPNPVGHNRVYVYCGDDFSYESWWRNLREGKCMVTNGPVLRVSADGHLPGYIFRSNDGEELAITPNIKLSTREKISYLEIIQNGQSVHEVRLDKLVENGGKLPPIRFRESGWFMIRAVCDNAQSYRCAFSGPFYVEFDGVARISRRSCEFFIAWLNELERESMSDDQKKYYESASRFWGKRIKDANTEF